MLVTHGISDAANVLNQTTHIEFKLTRNRARDWFPCQRL